MSRTPGCVQVNALKIDGLLFFLSVLIAMRRLLYPPLSVASVIAACPSVNPCYDASKKHHRPDGFNNHYIDNWHKTLRG